MRGRTLIVIAIAVVAILVVCSLPLINPGGEHYFNYKVSATFSKSYSGGDIEADVSSINWEVIGPQPYSVWDWLAGGGEPAQIQGQDGQYYVRVQVSEVLGGQGNVVPRWDGGTVTYTLSGTWTGDVVKSQEWLKVSRAQAYEGTFRVIVDIYAYQGGMSWVQVDQEYKEFTVSKDVFGAWKVA